MATTTSQDTPGGLAHKHERGRWSVLGLLALAQLMLVLDVTVVNVALPDIGADLQLSRAALPWVMTTYTLAFGGLMLLGGRVADLLGARRVLLAGLVLFTASSALGGLAGSALPLIASRAGQGVGAAFLAPSALALVMSTFTGSARSKALGVWATLSGVGAVAGVILGGVLTSEAGWRWIFYINVPIGIVLLAALPVLVPAHRPARSGVRLDVAGAVLVTSATGALIYGLINVGSHGWSTPSTLLPLALSAVLGSLVAVVERTAPAPLLVVHMIGNKAVAAGAFLILIATALLIGGFFLGSFLLQREHGYSAVHVGVAFLPIAVAITLGANAATQLLSRIDARIVAVVGLVFAASGYGVAAQWPRPAEVVIGLSVAAVGIGATFVTAFTVAMADVDPDEAGMRSAIVNTFHELGGALGVAVLSSLAATSLTTLHVSQHGFTVAYAAGAIAALAAAAVALVLVAPVKTHRAAGGHGH
jgi:EmrB/QacA subfamily drug resistance transporter